LNNSDLVNGRHFDGLVISLVKNRKIIKNDKVLKTDAIWGDDAGKKSALGNI
jgi:hypothetical protein